MIVKRYCIVLTMLTFMVSVLGDTNDNEVSNETRVLSRRKRFLIFPEGSSLQLVFCVTYPMLAVIGDILLWGNTAALAYELPQDPYSPFDHRADPLHRKVDTKSIYYTDYNGKVIHKEPYKRKPIVNPAFAKRSVDSEKVTEKFKINRKQMHDAKHKRDFLREHTDGKSVEFHRSSRMALYRRIEILLEGLGSNGRHCVLKALCEMGQTQSQKQGSFIQEIIRATFTLPKYKGIDEEEYDDAQYATRPCSDLYSECEGPLAGLNAPLAAN